MKNTEYKRRSDLIISGALCALAVVYEHDQETIAEEIINLFNPTDVLRVASEEDDYILPKLRRTIFGNDDA